MGQEARQKGDIPGLKRHGFPFNLHDPAVRIADADFQMVMKMQMLRFDVGDSPAVPAQQQDWKLNRQAVVAVLDDGLLFSGHIRKAPVPIYRLLVEGTLW
ncbi:hypothetical protein D3C80_1347620 [compost metagenome]